MYSFEGDFRRKPEQNLGGSSRKLPRNELIQRAAEERKQRQDLRNRIRAATIVQSSYRSYKCRKALHASLRNEFDAILQQIANGPMELPKFNILMKNLALFYREGVDDHRLSTFSQLVIKHKNLVVECIKIDVRQTLYRIEKLLHFNIHHLKSSINGAQPSVLAIPLRLIEIYTTKETYSSVGDSGAILLSMWQHLILKGYFVQMRLILVSKVPEPYEENSRPPTVLASSLLDLILRPLLLSHPGYSNIVVRHFFKDFLPGPLCPQIRYFALPAIVQNIPVALEPSNLLSALIDIDLHSRLCTSRTVLSSDLWMFLSLLKILCPQLGQITAHSDKIKHLCLLRDLASSLPDHSRDVATDDDDDEEVNGSSAFGVNTKEQENITNEIMEKINDPFHVQWLLTLIEGDLETSVIIPLTQLCRAMMCIKRLPVYNYRLLYTLAFKPVFIRQLWRYIATVSTPSVFGSPTPLLQLLSRGLPLAAVDWQNILPQFTVFCSLFSYLLPTLDDVEFYESEDSPDGQKSTAMPFSLDELRSMTLVLKDVCIGLIELAYHDTKLAVMDEYKNAMESVRETPDPTSQITDVKQWLKLFKTSVYLLKQLYTRDSRRQFCPDNHWISRQLGICIERPTSFRVGVRQRQRYQRFIGLRRLTREELEEEGPPLSTTEIRNVTILQEIPFVVPFVDRVKILHALMSKDREQNVGNLHQFMVPGSSIAVNIRRNYIYEDAFEKLSLENEPDLKRPIRVQLVNAVGLDEAGIDGGGIFREFLNELIKAAFDPNRGFFRTTTDRLLYPNPTSYLIVPDFQKHYYFIGRMLGKALYENMLVELPFSTFFLAKILAKHSDADIDIHHLASLDPLLYKNLVYLKNYDGDVSDMNLDFTVINSDLGENEVVELKAGGSNIMVTAQNRIEYIHLIADYRLIMTESWLRAYKEFLNQEHSFLFLQALNVSDKQDFIRGLQDVFLNFPMAETFKNDLIFDENGTEIIASRYIIQAKDILDANMEKDMLIALRQIADSFDMNITIFQQLFIFFDQFILVREISLQTITVAAIVMMAISLLFIPSPICAIWVAFSIISIEVGVIGYMTHWNVNLDTISMINLIMCIGFSVDFSAHISYAYISCPSNDPKEKVRFSLYSLGLPIFQGSCSTILGIVALAFAPSYIFLSFFKTVFLVMLFGALHGVLLLPVLLSLTDFCRGSKKDESKFKNNVGTQIPPFAITEKAFDGKMITQNGNPIFIPKAAISDLAERGKVGFTNKGLHVEDDSGQGSKSSASSEGSCPGEKDLGIGTSGEECSEGSWKANKHNVIVRKEAEIAHYPFPRNLSMPKPYSQKSSKRSQAEGPEEAHDNYGYVADDQLAAEFGGLPNRIYDGYNGRMKSSSHLKPSSSRLSAYHEIPAYSSRPDNLRGRYDAQLITAPKALQDNTSSVDYDIFERYRTRHQRHQARLEPGELSESAEGSRTRKRKEEKEVKSSEVKSDKSRKFNTRTGSNSR